LICAFSLTLCRHKAVQHALLEQMSRVVYSALLVSFRATSRLPGRVKAALPKHRAILDAIRARDPRGAATAMRHLVQTTAREIEAQRKRPRARR
jgi:DNA-binding FadR family transcriptional regulator